MGRILLWCNLIWVHQKLLTHCSTWWAQGLGLFLKPFPTANSILSLAAEAIVRLKGMGEPTTYDLSSTDASVNRKAHTHSWERMNAEPFSLTGLKTFLAWVHGNLEWK